KPSPGANQTNTFLTPLFFGLTTHPNAAFSASLAPARHSGFVFCLVSISAFASVMSGGVPSKRIWPLSVPRPLPSRGCLFPPPPPPFALSPPSFWLLLPPPPPPLLLLSPPPPQLARRIASIISGASRTTSRNRRVFIANLRRV